MDIKQSSFTLYIELYLKDNIKHLYIVYMYYLFDIYFITLILLNSFFLIEL